MGVRLSAGSHTLTAVAIDSYGLQGTASTQISLEVNDPPVVTITAPGAFTEILEDLPLTMTAVAVDPEEGGPVPEHHVELGSAWGARSRSNHRRERPGRGRPCPDGPGRRSARARGHGYGSRHRGLQRATGGGHRRAHQRHANVRGKPRHVCRDRRRRGGGGPDGEPLLVGPAGTARWARVAELVRADLRRGSHQIRAPGHRCDRQDRKSHRDHHGRRHSIRDAGAHGEHHRTC